jgi:hypothetical protein
VLVSTLVCIQPQSSPQYLNNFKWNSTTYQEVSLNQMVYVNIRINPNCDPSTY